jgi:hypothetical protein
VATSKIDDVDADVTNITGEHMTELDSHADQSCVGDNATVLYKWPDGTVEVGPFLDSLGCVRSAPIVTAAVAYDDPSIGKSILLIIHQAIFIRGLENNILCPMQMRHNGVTVNERPKHCTPIPTREDHAAIIPDGNHMIPLSISGVTSYFPSRKPARKERSRCRVNGDCLELTAESPIWDPHSSMFNDLEMRLVYRYGELKDNPGQLFTLATETLLHEPFMKLRISATTTSKRPGNWNTELLARNWSIRREAAERTLRATTRRGVREYNGNEVGVERRFPTGDRHLRYNRLNCSLYHDTLFSSIKSTRGNKCSQVYATDFCWSRNFSMKSKSDTHNTLDELLH